MLKSNVFFLFFFGISFFFFPLFYYNGFNVLVFYLARWISCLLLFHLSIYHILNIFFFPLLPIFHFCMIYFYITTYSVSLCLPAHILIPIFIKKGFFFSYTSA